MLFATLARCHVAGPSRRPCPALHKMIRSRVGNFAAISGARVYLLGKTPLTLAPGTSSITAWGFLSLRVTSRGPVRSWAAAVKKEARAPRAQPCNLSSPKLPARRKKRVHRRGRRVVFVSFSFFLAQREREREEDEIVSAALAAPRLFRCRRIITFMRVPIMSLYLHKWHNIYRPM